MNWILVILSLIQIIIGEKILNYAFHYVDDETLQLNSQCTTSSGTNGLCKRAVDCPKNKLKLTVQDICCFEQNDPVVCCENELDQIDNTNGNNSEYKSENMYSVFGYVVFDSNRTVDHKCVDYNLPYRVQYINGTRYQVYFYIGGELSKRRNNPHMAAIGWRSWEGQIDWKCGGSLISANFVVTAAHCVFERNAPAEVVRVGDLNLLVENDTLSQDFNITDIYVHPNYDPQLMYHDIALLKISPNATFTADVKPACLWAETHVPYSNLIAMGYGTNAFAGKRTNELYEGNLTHILFKDCRESFGLNSDLPNGIISSQICAKDLEGKQDTCQGDSGGPLVFKSGNGVEELHHLVGITSFGDSCAGQKPGVYTRISSYIDWIEKIVWPVN